MNNDTKVITGKVRLDYCHVWEPQENENGISKYGCVILIPKTDADTIKNINNAITAAKEKGKQNLGGKLPINYKLPLRDGDEEREDKAAYLGMYFINCNSNKQPDIVKPFGKTPEGKTKLAEITDRQEVYSGCYARVSINFYPFDYKGNRGVACGLNSVVKVSDGEYLGGRGNVHEDYADIDFDDNDNYDF